MNLGTLRIDRDPRIVLTGADCRAIQAGAEYTPTDLRLMEAGTHPTLRMSIEPARPANREQRSPLRIEVSPPEALTLDRLSIIRRVFDTSRDAAELARRLALLNLTGTWGVPNATVWQGYDAARYAWLTVTRD